MLVFKNMVAHCIRNGERGEGGRRVRKKGKGKWEDGRGRGREGEYIMYVCTIVSLKHADTADTSIVRERERREKPRVLAYCWQNGWHSSQEYKVSVDTNKHVNNMSHKKPTHQLPFCHLTAPLEKHWKTLCSTVRGRVRTTLCKYDTSIFHH